MMNTPPITIEHQMIATNGVTLHVAQAGPAGGPLVILLHGFPEFWYGWRRQMLFLAERGYRVWAPDQRGYNLSDKPTGLDAYRLHLLIEDIIGLIDAAGEQKTFLAGHDWGAAVAWGVALVHPERLKKMVILNLPHPKVYVDALRGNLAQMLKNGYIGLFQLPVVLEALLTMGDAQLMAQLLIRSGIPRTFSDADISEYTRAWKQPGAMTAMLNWYRAVVQRMPRLPDDLHIHVPTLVIWGAQDIALSRELAQRSVEMCDDGKLVMFEEASHWVHHDKPDKVNALLAEFFQEQSES
jgi:pimeloyl-ACP methyl ester carboxylesterase